MTPDELTAIRARTDAATVGDWRHSQYTEPYTNAAGRDSIRGLQIGPFTAIKGYICCTVADAVFVCESHSDVPALLDALDQATTLVRELRTSYWKSDTSMWDLMQRRLPWEVPA